MFFVFGISGKEKKLDFSQTTICKTCESYGRLEAFMTYSHFSLFLYPLSNGIKNIILEVLVVEVSIQ